MNHTFGHDHVPLPFVLNSSTISAEIRSKVDKDGWEISLYDVTHARRRILQVVISDTYLIKHLLFSGARSTRDARRGAARGDAENIWQIVQDLEVSANGQPMTVRVKLDVDVNRFQLQIFVGQQRLVDLVSQDPEVIQHVLFSEGRSARDAYLSGAF